MKEFQFVSQKYKVPLKGLLGFVILTFTITWSIVGVYILASDMAIATFGAIHGGHPLFFLATWAPAIAAFSVVIYFTGFSGLKTFLSRLFLWRCSPGWICFILFVVPIIFIVGSLLKNGPMFAPLPPEGVSGMVTVLLIMLFLGPIEEFGWRGVAQPVLQRYITPFWAGLIIGAVWGIWHLPAFFLSSTVFAGWSFIPFFIGNIALAILVTPIFNESRGSLLWPMLFHWQLINPFWADAQPYDTWILVLITIVVVWCKRDSMFTSDRAITHVVSDQLIADQPGDC